MSMHSMKAHYVVVFPFDFDGKHVLLIEKQKPDYLRGKWNGPGGRVEPGESIFNAAARELEEETGITVFSRDFNHIISMEFYETNDAFLAGEYLRIDFLTIFNNVIHHARKMEEEEVTIWPVHYALGKEHYSDAPRLVSNLYWMLPYALDKYKYSLLHCKEIQETAR